MIGREQEHQFDILTHEISRRGLLKTGALGLSVVLSRLITPYRVSAEPARLEAVFDVELHPNQRYTTPDTHFMTVKGDVLVDGVDVKNSDDPNLGTLGRTFRTRVEILAPFGANIHGNSDRTESDKYYEGSAAEIRAKGCLSGCSNLREWYRGDPNADISIREPVTQAPTVLPTTEVSRGRGVCVTESPINPGQELPIDPFDYEVCAGATLFVPRQSVIQGDVEPIENGRPRVTWHDSEENTGLITITGRDGFWRFNWGGDVYVDPDLDRLLAYAQEMAVLMKSRGCGTGIGCPAGVSILRWPDDKGQGE